MPKRHQNRQAKEQVGRNNPKKATGYVLWNRLNQVAIPARLDESNQ